MVSSQKLIQAVLFTVLSTTEANLECTLSNGVREQAFLLSPPVAQQFLASVILVSALKVLLQAITALGFLRELRQMRKRAWPFNMPLLEQLIIYKLSTPTEPLLLVSIALENSMVTGLS